MDGLNVFCMLERYRFRKVKGGCNRPNVFSPGFTHREFTLLASMRVFEDEVFRR